MKIKLVIFVLTLFFSSLSFTTNAQFWLGGKLGGTSASITGSGLKSFVPTPKMYFNGGASASFHINSRFALLLELMYNGKGSAIQYQGDYNGMNGVIEFEQKLHYFAIPLMLQFKMGDKENYFHFDAGLVHNSLIGQKFNGDITVTELNGDESIYSIESGYVPLKTDFSYAFGVGLVANGITFDFRYEVGKNKIYSEEVNNPTIYNRAFMVSVGYMFKLL
jgi:hypothetical protein